MKKWSEKKGQVWVETVIYTLIALTMIGAVLAFVIPKIEEIRDKAVIEQSIDVMENINEVLISAVQGGSGNKRVIDVEIGKGTLNINSSTDQLFFEIDGGYVFSEEGQIISIGSIDASTQNVGSTYRVTLKSDYSRYNITYSGDELNEMITQSPTSYTISIENRGTTNGKINIDFKVI